MGACTSIKNSRQSRTSFRALLDEHIKDETAQFGKQEVDRVREEKMKNLPHRLIGIVLCRGPGNALQTGTGVLISANLVLTSAHVIFHSIQFKPFPKIYFYPGHFGRLINHIQVDDYAYPEEYQKRQPQYKSYDYCLLKLKQNVEENEFLELNTHSIAEDEKPVLSLFGYPESRFERQNGIIDETKQYGLTKTDYVLDVMEEAGYILHRITTEKGQSGAPLIHHNSKGKRTIIGIHAGSTEQYVEKYKTNYPELTKINLTKITSTGMVRRLKKFAKQLDGEMFKVYEPKKSVINRMQIENNELKDRLKRTEQEHERKLREEQGENRRQRQISEKIKKGQESSQREIELVIASPSQIRQINQNYGRTVDGYDLKAQGDKMFKDKNYKEAIFIYQKIVDMTPKHVDSYRDLALALQHDGRHQDAIQYYQIAVEIDPVHDITLNNLGYSLAKVKEWEKAIQCYRKAIEIDTKFAVVYINLRKIPWLQVSGELLRRTLTFLENVHPQGEDISNTIRYLEGQVKKRR